MHICTVLYYLQENLLLYRRQENTVINFSVNQDHPPLYPEDIHSPAGRTLRVNLYNALSQISMYTEVFISSNTKGWKQLDQI
jgi:hypothetical protein